MGKPVSVANIQQDVLSSTLAILGPYLSVEDFAKIRARNGQAAPLVAEFLQRLELDNPLGNLERERPALTGEIKKTWKKYFPDFNLCYGKDFESFPWSIATLNEPALVESIENENCDIMFIPKLKDDESTRPLTLAHLLKHGMREFPLSKVDLKGFELDIELQKPISGWYAFRLVDESSFQDNQTLAFYVPGIETLIYLVAAILKSNPNRVFSGKRTFLRSSSILNGDPVYLSVFQDGWMEECPFEMKVWSSPPKGKDDRHRLIYCRKSPIYMLP